MPVALRFILLSLALAACAPLAHAKSPARRADEFFGRDRVVELNLTLSPAAWDEIQPNHRPRGLGLFDLRRPGFRPAAQPAPVPATLGRHGSYPIVRAVLESAGERPLDIGLRYKGNTSYMGSSRYLNRPLKLDFNAVDPDGTFAGLSALKLGNNTLDPSHLREVLSYEIFRRAGVPAPRARPVRVSWRIDGIDSPQDLGVYSAVEEVDKDFLKRHFGSAKGLLLKPEGAEGLPYFGEDFARYRGTYGPKTEPTARTSARLIDFLRLVHRGTPDEFAERIESFLPMDEFLRFVAANVLLANMDSLLSTGHNFYLYVHPDTGKIHFIPWDLNFSFGGYVRTGDAGELASMSIHQFWIGDDELLRRVLAIPAHKQRYLEILADLNETVFAPQRLHPRLAELQKMLGSTPATAPAARPAQAPKELAGLPVAPELKSFIEARHKSVAGQLAGRGEGVYEPHFKLGPVGSYLYR